MPIHNLGVHWLKQLQYKKQTDLAQILSMLFQFKTNSNLSDKKVKFQI